MYYKKRKIVTIMKKLSKRIISYLPVFFLILFPFLFFYPVFAGKMILVGDFSGSDLMDLHYPFKQSLHEAYTNGRLPLWESNLSLGFPLAAEGQSGPFYPLNIILSFLATEWALQISIISVFVVCLLGTYLYAKTLKLSKFEAVFAAVTFSFSAFFVTRIKHLNLIAVSAWLPFAFFSIRKFFQKKNAGYSLLTGTFFAFMFLAGHPQMAFYCIFVSLLYIIFEAFSAFKRNKDPMIFPKTLTFIFFSVILAAGLSAIQLLPTFEFIQHTARGQFHILNAAAYPFRLTDLANFISPFGRGNPATATYRANIALEGVFWENANYIGLLGIVLAVAGAFFIIKERSSTKRVYFFFLGLASFSLLTMLGTATFVFPFLWDNIPGFNFFRFPNRFNLFLLFSLSLIAAKTSGKLVNNLTSLKTKTKDEDKSPRDDEVRLTWPLDRGRTFAILIIITLLDLFVFANTYIGYADKDKFTKTPKFTEKIKSDERVRLYSITQHLQSPYQAAGWKDEGAVEAITAVREAIPPDNNILFNIDSFNDRGWFEGGLSLARRDRVEKYLLNENQDQVLTGKLLGLFNVKYIITFNDYLGVVIYKEDEIELSQDFATTLKLFRNDQVLPRVYYTPEALVVENEDEAFNQITSLEHFGPRTVILEDHPKILPGNFTGSLDNFKEENKVEIANYQNTQVEIKAKINDHGFLVLNDIFYPGWKAYLCNTEQRDECEETQILRANYLVRAVELEPGNYTVLFKYQPQSFNIASIITLSTIAAAVATSSTLAARRLINKRAKSK
jgi:hypothetical protein